MAQTTANADAVLQDYYLKPIREQLNQRRVIMFQSKGDGSPDSSKGESVPFRGFDKDSELVQFAGRQWVLPAHTSRNEGVGAIEEGGTLPVAGQQGWQDLKDTIRHNVGTIKLTRYAIKLSNRNVGAFLKLLEGETKGLVKDISKDVCRQAYSNQTGALAAVTADEAESKITVDTVQYLRVGMRIDIVHVSTDTVLASNRTITKINATTKVVTYSGEDVEATTSHRICRTGNWKKEINGLGNLIGTTGEIHGIDATEAGNEWWQSVMQDASESSFSEDVAQQIVDGVGSSGNGEVELILGTRGIRRRYIADLKSQKRFTDADSVKLHGGFKAIMFNEMPFTFDDDLPKGNVFFLNTDAFMWVYLEDDWDWVDDDGAILSRATDRSDAFEGYLAADHDLAITARNQVGKYYNLADDAAGTWK